MIGSGQINFYPQKPNPKTAPQSQGEANPERSNQDKLEQLVKSSKNIIYQIKTHRLFDLFPDRLVIDIGKISVIYQEFFDSEEVRSINLDTISDVTLGSTPFSATLYFVSKDLKQNILKIGPFKTTEAQKARRIIHGLIAAKKEKIDLTGYSSQQLTTQLEEIGRAREQTS